MTHDQAVPLLDAYRHGRLDREVVRQLHAHFKDCEACRSLIRLQRAALEGRTAMDELGLVSPEIQKQMARNRDLMIKILLLMFFALLVWRHR